MCLDSIAADKFVFAHSSISPEVNSRSMLLTMAATPSLQWIEAFSRSSRIYQSNLHTLHGMTTTSALWSASPAILTGAWMSQELAKVQILSMSMHSSWTVSSSRTSQHCDRWDELYWLDVHWLLPLRGQPPYRRGRSELLQLFLQSRFQHQR